MTEYTATGRIISYVSIVVPPRGPFWATCAACGQSVDTIEAHQGHEPGCEFAAGLADRCDCDRPTHPDCCCPGDAS